MFFENTLNIKELKGKHKLGTFTILKIHHSSCATTIESRLQKIFSTVEKNKVKADVFYQICFDYRKF